LRKIHKRQEDSKTESQRNFCSTVWRIPKRAIDLKRIHRELAADSLSLVVLVPVFAVQCDYHSRLMTLKQRRPGLKKLEQKVSIFRDRQLQIFDSKISRC